MADGGGLENRYRETYRGFESHALRSVIENRPCFIRRFSICMDGPIVSHGGKWRRSKKLLSSSRYTFDPGVVTAPGLMERLISGF